MAAGAISWERHHAAHTPEASVATRVASMISEMKRRPAGMGIGFPVPMHRNRSGGRGQTPALCYRGAAREGEGLRFGLPATSSFPGDLQIPEDTVRLVAGARREEEPRGILPMMFVPSGPSFVIPIRVPRVEREPPETRDRDGRAGRIGELTPESAVLVEEVDPAVPEVPDQDLISQAPRAVARHLGQAPGRVEGSLGRESADEGSVGAIDVDVAVPRTGFIIHVVRPLLLGIRDVEVAVDILNVEGREPRRDARVGERLRRHVLEVLVEDIHLGALEIRRVEEGRRAAPREREPLVDRTGRRVVRDDDGSIAGAPGRDHPVLAREDEPAHLIAPRNHETPGGIEHAPGGGYTPGLP